MWVKNPRNFFFKIKCVENQLNNTLDLFHYNLGDLLWTYQSIGLNDLNHILGLDRNYLSLHFFSVSILTGQNFLWYHHVSLKNENNILKYCKMPIIKISWHFLEEDNTLFVVYMHKFSLYFSFRDLCSGLFCFRLYRVTRKLWEFHDWNFTLNKGVDRKKCSRGEICPKRKKFVLPPSP